MVSDGIMKGSIGPNRETICESKEKVVCLSWGPWWGSPASYVNLNKKQYYIIHVCVAYFPLWHMSKMPCHITF